MSLIIKGSITKLKKGYSTVANAHDVVGGVVDATSGNIANGQLVKFTDTTGFYVGVDATNTIANASDVAGFRLAVNVKLINSYPGNGEVLTLPGEALDVLVKGAIAVHVSFTYETDTEGTTNRDAAFALLRPNKPVYATAAGVITTTATSNIALPAVFSGVISDVVETVDTDAGTTTVTCLAEIYYNF